MGSTGALPTGHRVFKVRGRGQAAEGGMAEVYLAYKDYGQPTQELMVLKRIKPHLRANQQYIDMFKNEAKVAGVLNHENVVQLRNRTRG